MVNSNTENGVKASGQQIKKSWHGVDRFNLAWYPIINLSACTGCGLCVLTCGNSVFQWNTTEKKPVVALPQNCVLGCTTCGKTCPQNAISFPEDPKIFIKGLIIKYKIYPKVREELSARLAKFPDHIVDNKKREMKPSSTAVSNEFAHWHGIDRSKINWHPLIDPNKCTGCGLCVVTCSEKRNVFGFDVEKHKSVVLYPNNCMVGCNNCEAACLWNAISYPEDVEYVRSLARNLNQETLDKELMKKLSSNPSLIFPKQRVKD